MRIFRPLIAASLLLGVLWTNSAQAFCGFYVARADGELFNESSKVVFVRDGTRSVITVSSDYRGPALEFALVMPTPEVLPEAAIRTVEGETLAHLDAYSAPRLVEYHDTDPCEPRVVIGVTTTALAEGAPLSGPAALGVTVEAEYAVGVYDVAILSAEQSDGLATYLRQEAYQIPEGAEAVMAPYIENGMKFFVARVNLDRHEAAESAELPPLQLSFTSRAFMLPLQLGKINAAGEQDVLVMALTRTGRVEAANYANARIPSEIEVPGFVRDRFGEFYRRIYDVAAAPDTVLTEYVWDMAWCDPCAADPLSVAQLRELGADWVEDNDGPARDVFITRLHFRYGPDEFAEDLFLRETGDTENFQGRYIIRNPFDGPLQCAPEDEETLQVFADEYLVNTKERLIREGDTLARLTGWDREMIAEEIRGSTPDIYHD